MRFSRTLKSSTQSLPSPDGSYIATIFPAKLSIRDTRSLATIRVISLPPDLAASIAWFLWSPSSKRVLVGSGEYIRVYSATDTKFSATITSPTSGLTKAAYVAFGADENEVCVFSDFGLKLSVFNLVTLKSVDISSPKLYQPGIAARGLTYRPGTSNLTLMTRSGGKDMISIHARDTLDVVRSWSPDTIDAQGFCWSVDGRWLNIWESASQGHRMLMYTADGYLFRTWNGPVPISSDDVDITLGAGIKMIEWSQNGALVAIGDFGRRVTILSAQTFTETISLLHTASVTPADTLKIWQEQITHSLSGSKREFVLAEQAISLPTLPAPQTNNLDVRTGTSMLCFDSSSTLLATRTENMPTTIWIWDLQTRALRSVMVFHAPVAKATWHPTINEMLMIRCEGDEARGLMHLWDPSWETPQIVDFGAHIPGGRVIGRTIIRWLNSETPHPTIFFSDSQDYLLASLSAIEDGDLHWQETDSNGVSIYGEREESPLVLMPATQKRQFRKVVVEEPTEEFNFSEMSGGSDEIDDTFHFKRGIDS